MKRFLGFRKFVGKLSWTEAWVFSCWAKPPSKVTFLLERVTLLVFEASGIWSGRRGKKKKKKPLSVLGELFLRYVSPNRKIKKQGVDEVLKIEVLGFTEFLENWAGLKFEGGLLKKLQSFLEFEALHLIDLVQRSHFVLKGGMGF